MREKKRKRDADDQHLTWESELCMYMDFVVQCT